MDLVLNGHSHVYERSFLMYGHYGLSVQLKKEMILQDQSGNLDEPYVKKGKRSQGTIYAVVGNSGKQGGPQPTWPHPVMAYANWSDMGSMKIEVKGDTLQARFIDLNSKVKDEFYIIKL